MGNESAQSRVSHERISIIRKLFAEGRTVTEIAERLRLARSTVSYILNRKEK